MKYSASLLSLLLAFFPSAAISQHVTLTVRNARFPDVLDSIRKQTGIVFLYADSAVSRAKPVTFKLHHATVAEALSKCFAAQPFGFDLLHGTVVIVHRQSAGENAHTIRGSVIDPSGPVAGASLRLANTPRGSITDANGKFMLTAVSLPAALDITCVGFEARRQWIRDDQPLTIVMRPLETQLEQAIVQGYYTTTRRFNTASVSAIAMKDIGPVTTTDPLSQLEGRLPGVFVSQVSGAPGTAFKLQIRGVSSIESGSSPLYLIDGVPFGPGTFTSSFGGGSEVVRSPIDILNANDIASITVLKDADATAIYGSRGANGVIMITMKKSTAQPSVEVSSFRGAGRVTRSIPLMNRRQYLDMRYEAFNNDDVDWRSSDVNASDLKQWDTTSSADWQKLLLGASAAIQNINVALNAGNASTSFRLATSYASAGTVYPKNFGEKKWSTGLSLQHRCADNRVAVSLYALYSVNKSELPQADLVRNIFSPPVAPKMTTETGDINWANNSWTNPFRDFLATYSSVSNNLLAQVRLSFRVLPHVEFTSMTGFNQLDDNDVRSTAPEYFPPSTPVIAFTPRVNYDLRIQTIIEEPQLTWTESAGKDNFSAALGASYQRTIEQTTREEGGDNPDDADTGYSPYRRNINISGSEYRYLAGFFRFDYSRSKRYLLNVTARRDGSSRFGNTRPFGNFGAIGIGWIFTQAKPTKDTAANSRRKRVDFGKIRMSIGIVGNDQIGNYNYLAQYSRGRSDYDTMPTLEPVRLANPDLHWERVVKSEVGVELRFNRSRTMVELSAYRNQSTDELLHGSVPMITGFPGILANEDASVINSGLELTINSENIHTAVWDFRSSLILTVNRNRLISYAHLTTSQNRNRYIIGEPLELQRTLHLRGVDPVTGVYQFTEASGDGIISSPADAVSLTRVAPRYFGGLNNDLRYKGLHLEVFVQLVGQNGKSILNLLSAPGRMQNQPAVVTSRWQRDGDDGPFQKYSAGPGATADRMALAYSSDLMWEDASYVRLRMVRLEYSFGAKAISKVRAKSANVFIMGENLLTITKYSGLDPETQLHLPPMKTVGAGIQVQF